MRDLVAYGLAYLAPVAPLTTLGFVWEASGGLIVAAYLLAALCIYFTARSYAVMVAEVPSAGSVYGYAQMALGPAAGFVAGWMILLDYLLSPAFVYALMAVGMESLVPALDRSIWIVLIVAVTFSVNWFGVQLTTRVSLFSVAFQFLLVALIVVLCATALAGGKGNGGLTLAPLFSPARFDPVLLLNGVGMCVLAFLGFDAISTLAEEMQADQVHRIGRAILIVMGVATVAFSTTVWVLGDLIVGLDVHDPAGAIYELMGWAFAPALATALAWTMIIVGGFSNALPVQVGVARVLFAMGRDGRLPRGLAKVHAKTGSPYVAMAASTLGSLVISELMRDQIDLLASLVSVGAMAGFVLLHLSVIKHFNRRADRNWRLHVASPLLGMLGLLVVIFNMQARSLVVGAAWLALGACVFLWRRGEVRVVAGGPP